RETERPQPHGAAAGEDSGAESMCERSLRTLPARNRRGRAFILADARGSSALARGARRRLPAAHQLASRNPRGVVVEVMQLTEAEAVFRALKSELAVRRG